MISEGVTTNGLIGRISLSLLVLCHNRICIFSATGTDSTFPLVHEGHLARGIAAAIVLNIGEGRWEAHQKHEGHNRKFTRLSASLEISPPLSPSPSIPAELFSLRMVFSLSIKIWRFMTIKTSVYVLS
jgi:hypothetical protein